MSAEFQTIFIRLRTILAPYAKTLAVTQDSSDQYCLTGGLHPTHKTPMPVAWVEIAKNYVGFHHMGVYAFPKLRDEMSAELKARMQGKSCFNFKTVEENLFQELEQVTTKGFVAFKQAGFLSGPTPARQSAVARRNDLHSPADGLVAEIVPASLAVITIP